ncbi:MAG: DUF2252 domain-containing protein [Steroidobacteraceae bacterium]|nr:DUF2252 domain-containing protein [Steroidobacteraceae bacterium]
MKATKKSRQRAAPPRRSPRKAPRAPQRHAAEGQAFRSREECLLAGKALREALPRHLHAGWKPPSKGQRDPIAILEASNQDRVPDLVPIRYGRMLRSPFTFLRGSAGLMASDLARTPSTGLRVQACGDCHLMNFGLFATPERNLIFDINDFDETLPAPWEWDVKRLAVSFAVAARDNGHTDAQARAAAIGCVRSYREHLRDYSKRSPLDVWYDRLDEKALIEAAPDAEALERRKSYAAKARTRVAEYLFPKISEEVGGRRRLVDQLPTLFHVQEEDAIELVRLALVEYRRSLPDPVRVMFDRYRLEDFAVKVVGIGSVGTRCFVGLFFSPENHPLLLQFKEARHSVLEPFAGKSSYDNQGQRVVCGQRLMQSSSDILLGWTRSIRGRDFFIRQLRDMKLSLPVEGASPVQLKRYADYCGWTLARAHAKSGDAATISGYLGRTDNFDQAIGRFALAYADQNERDYSALVAAVKAGRVEALIEENL